MSSLRRHRHLLFIIISRSWPLWASQWHTCFPMALLPPAMRMLYNCRGLPLLDNLIPCLWQLPHTCTRSPSLLSRPVPFLLKSARCSRSTRRRLWNARDIPVVAWSSRGILSFQRTGPTRATHNRLTLCCRPVWQAPRTACPSCSTPRSQVRSSPGYSSLPRVRCHTRVKLSLVRAILIEHAP